MMNRNMPLAAGLCGGLLLLAAPASAPAAAATDPAAQVWSADGRDAAGRRALDLAPVLRSAGGPRGEPQGEVAANWQALGPFGGDVADVAASPTAPTVVLAAVAASNGGGGLYRSGDGGSTWSRLAVIPGVGVRDIEFEASGRVLVGTDAGLWISSDDGASWTMRDLGIGDYQGVLDITLDPSDSNILWAAISDSFGQQPVNLMRSTDGGLTWIDRTPPHPQAMSGTAVAIDPADSEVVIAGFGGSFGGGEVWVSTDGGRIWTDRSAGLPPNPVRALHYNGVRLLVGGGQLFGSQYLGLYGSGNLGGNWIPLAGSWPVPVASDIAVDPNDSETILVAIDGAGVNRSTDGGATWETGIGGTASLSVQALRFRPASSSALLLGASSLGVYRSEDGGDSFTVSTSGIAELPLYSIDASPVDPGQLAAAFQGSNNGGVYTSSDGGASWQPAPVPPTRYSKVAFAPDGTLYAMSSGPSTIAPEGLYRRNPDGSWSGIGPDQGNLFESDLAPMLFSASDPDLIYLGGSDYGVAGDQATVWRSTDAGVNWTKLFLGGHNERITAIEFSDGAGQHLVAGYDGSDTQAGGAVRSLDGGATWQAALNGLGTWARMPRLCRSQARPDVLWMTVWESWGSGALYRSGDEGASWQSVWSGSPAVDVACDQDDGERLYVAQLGADRVLTSADGGASFSAFSGGLANAGDVTELALSRSGAPRLFLSSMHGSFATERAGSAQGETIFADGFE